jgi:hypothetical protein
MAGVSGLLQKNIGAKRVHDVEDMAFLGKICSTLADALNRL